TPKIRMQIQTYGESQVQLVAGQVRVRLEAVSHPPSNCLVGETVFAFGASLFDYKLDVLAVEDTRRKHQAHLLTGKDGFRITLPERLQAADALQEWGSHAGQRDHGINPDFWHKIFEP